MTFFPKRPLALALLSLGLLGCRGEMLATARLTAPGTAEARFITTKKVALWSDWDAEWQGTSSKRFPIIYEVEVLQAGAHVGAITCESSPSSSVVCGGTSSIFGKNSGNCEVLMRCKLPPTKPGEIVLRVTGRLGDPANTQKVSNMSLNVRED